MYPKKWGVSKGFAERHGQALMGKSEALQGFMNLTGLDLVLQAGFEPAAPGLGILCSILLSYWSLLIHLKEWLTVMMAISAWSISSDLREKHALSACFL